MSLHTLAQHLQSAGRGDDKLLVHMTPHEVSGLQSLAMAHGGSLTINPETGLPEAGFLSGILPMVAGAALAATGVGAPMAALMVGGAGAVATGSLQKGLMMGLGAFGGAGLGAGLLGSAAAAPAAAAASSAVPSAVGAGQALTATGLAGSPAAAMAPAATMPGVTALAPTMQATTPGLAGVQGGPVFGQPQPPVVSTAPAAPATVGAQSVESATSMFDKLKSMPSKAFDLLSGSGPEAEKAREDFYEKNKKYLIAGGIGTLAMSRDEPKAAKQESGGYQTFNPTYNRIAQSGGNYQAGAYPSATGERRYFADGGLANLPVEQMSQQASVGANTNFPMANLRPYGYATPRNNPISENVFKPADYERVDPYTGEAKFAGGGLTSLVSMATGGFVSKIKPVSEPKKATPKLADIGKLDKQVASYEKFGSYDDAKNKVADLQSQLKGLNKKSSEYKSINAELSKANSILGGAKKYSDAVAARDKANAANEAATNKANQQYEDAMSKYNEYKNAVEDEKKAWQEETGRKATGIQSVRPQSTTTKLGGPDNSAKIAELKKQLDAAPASMSGASERQKIQSQIDALKSGASAGYTPAYIKDPKTGKLIPSSEAPPITEFKSFSKVPGFDTTKRLIEEKDINAIFQDVAGRRPTSAEMQQFLGLTATDADIAKYAMNAADVKQAMKYTDDDFKENFQYYVGRQPTSGELAAMRRAKIGNFNQMRNFIQAQPSYLKNLNTVAQQAFQAEQKSAEEALAEQARLASSLTPEQVSTAYKDALGRPPTMEELSKYKGAQQTQEGLAGILKGSEEYMGKLTQPFIPTPTPKYAPGAVLEYTPQQQAATGLGAITAGVQPTPSGLQAPLTRGAVTLEGAMPLNPTFQEQLGLQTLATQAAEKAPALQTGLQFAAQQPQNMFGFQPYAQPTQPQSLEALMAALRAQQAQGVTQMAEGGMAGGGYTLGDYSDGGRLLKGPGDGVNDQIPATIADKQPARLANNEFVIPARIVSELGNGSTDAGARKLYAMMERVQKARNKSMGKGKVAVDTKADRFLPA